MNNGANIIYLGTDELVQLPGDKLITDSANLTNLLRSFAIRKDRKSVAINALVDGVGASGYSNLYLFGLAVETKSETHCFFECSFFGILSGNEGGRSSGAEHVEEFSNVAVFGGVDTQKYKQPVKRFSYTVPQGNPDRMDGRTITVPDIIKVRNLLNGSITETPGSFFFWDQTDLERRNFGRYDRIQETWTLRTFVG